jgi:hypothetical protein
MLLLRQIALTAGDGREIVAMILRANATGRDAFVAMKCR